MTNRPAFTLVELLLGVAVSTIIFVSATSAYVFLLKTSTKLNQSQSLDQAKNDLFQELSHAIRWAPQGGVTLTPTELVVNGTVYKLDSQTLTRAGQPLVSSPISVTGFTFTNSSALADYVSLHIIITLQDTSVSPSRGGTLDFIVSQRQTYFTHEE